MSESAPAPEGPPVREYAKKPICILVVGMAGSGKTTFMQSEQKKHYVINLDPAVGALHYSPNIDIRDTVNYKEVMKQYKLGPNGGILTSLNLFATRFDQVLKFVESKKDDLEYILVDTPGQIEIFTWSASGAIIMESMATAMRTVVVYVVDTCRTTQPQTFMSNMTYACSIMYKSRLPFIVAFNKIDVTRHDFAIEWMNDFDSFQDALKYSGGESNYMTSLTGSLSLMLDEFYSTFKSVGVSAVTGEGSTEFFEAVDAAGESFDEFAEEYNALAKKRYEEEVEKAKANAARLAADLEKDERAGATVMDASGMKSGFGEEEESEEDEEERAEYEQFMREMREEGHTA